MVTMLPLAGHFEHPRDFESGDAELLGDLDLAAVLQIEAPSYGHQQGTVGEFARVASHAFSHDHIVSDERFASLI